MLIVLFVIGRSRLLQSQVFAGTKSQAKPYTFKIVAPFPIQIHISDSHEDVLETLKRKVGEAGWNQEQVQNIILLYLSPSDSIAQEMKGRFGNDDTTTYVTRAMTKKSQPQPDPILQAFLDYHAMLLYPSIGFSTRYAMDEQ